MVQASTLILAAFAVVPVLSAPLSVHNNAHSEAIQQRSVDSIEDLDLRDPKFNFGKVFRKVANVVKKVAVPAASLLLRDEDGNLVMERELDLAELAELDARSPTPFNFKKLLRGGLKVAATAAKILIRDEEGNIYIRDVDTDDLSERDQVSDLDARDIYYLDLSELSERDLSELDLDLESREPFRLGNLVKKVGRVASKATRVAGTVANVASSFGFREIEDDVLEVDARDEYYAIDDVVERELAEDFEELDARDNQFRTVRGGGKKRGLLAKRIHGVVRHFPKVAKSLGIRELEDEIAMEARSLEDLD